MWHHSLSTYLSPHCPLFSAHTKCFLSEPFSFCCWQFYCWEIHLKSRSPQTTVPHLRNSIFSKVTKKNLSWNIISLNTGDRSKLFIFNFFFSLCHPANIHSWAWVLWLSCSDNIYRTTVYFNFVFTIVFNKKF